MSEYEAVAQNALIMQRYLMPMLFLFAVKVLLEVVGKAVKAVKA
ncbi:MAG: hypothetical protein ACXQTI_03740 [Candidatus Nezhaarchaeales archaeon]